MHCHDRSIEHNCVVFEDEKQTQKSANGILIKDDDEYVLHIDTIVCVTPGPRRVSKYVSMLGKKSRFEIVNLMKERSECKDHLMELIYRWSAKLESQQEEFMKMTPRNLRNVKSTGKFWDIIYEL